MCSCSYKKLAIIIRTARTGSSQIQPPSKLPDNSPVRIKVKIKEFTFILVNQEHFHVPSKNQKLLTQQKMGISRDKWHKRRLVGGHKASETSQNIGRSYVIKASLHYGVSKYCYISQLTFRKCLIRFVCLKQKISAFISSRKM